MLLVSNLINVRYLTGYTGSNGIALIGADVRTFVTDFRYLEQAAAEVDPAFDRRRCRAAPARGDRGRAPDRASCAWASRPRTCR